MHWLVVIHLGAGTLARGCSEISLRVTPPAAASPQQQWRALLPAAPQLLQLLQSWQLLYREYYETCGDARAVEINASDIVRFSEIEFRQLAERLAAEFNGWLASESFASAIRPVVWGGGGGGCFFVVLLFYGGVGLLVFCRVFFYFCLLPRGLWNCVVSFWGARSCL